MTQFREVRGRATAIATIEGKTQIIYHGTPVVSFDDKEVTLDTGGWNTVTTRARMNQTANQYGLGFQVFQKAGQLFVQRDGMVPEPFTQTITFKRR